MENGRRTRQHDIPILQLHSLTITYGSRRVLREVSLGLHAGEVLALIGPNGAGKSTLIRAASGRLTPARGRVFVRGHDVRGWPPEARARLIAVAPQAVHLPEAFTALETVLMGRTPYLGWLGRERASDCAIAQQALARVNALELADRRVGELSGGEQQRVLIARALAQAAPVLLLDEPTAHLDLKHQAGLLSLVRALAHEEGLAVLIALHDLNLAAHYADRVALLADGELRALGAPAETLTTTHLSAAYGLPVQVLAHPLHGVPLIVPDGHTPLPTERRRG
jgi:iron complex transport system ATP-binding protein